MAQFNAEEKKVIVTGKIAGKSNRELVFDLFEASGRRTDAYALGKLINADESIASAIETVKDRLLDGVLDELVSFEDE